MSQPRKRPRKVDAELAAFVRPMDVVGGTKLGNKRQRGTPQLPKEPVPGAAWEPIAIRTFNAEGKAVEIEDSLLVGAYVGHETTAAALAAVNKNTADYDVVANPDGIIRRYNRRSKLTGDKPDVTGLKTVGNRVDGAWPFPNLLPQKADYCSSETIATKCSKVVIEAYHRSLRSMLSAFDEDGKVIDDATLPNMIDAQGIIPGTLTEEE